MQDRTTRRTGRRAGFVITAAALALALPGAARAQYSAPRLASDQPIGERYHVEVSGTFWNPSPTGTVSSEQWGLVGSDIDFTNDLGFAQTRFKEFRLVLRPTTRSKFRIQYTPVQYSAASTLHRDIVFNGIRFPVALPVQSEFGWKVWRFGYEYDVAYDRWGYVGVVLEGRYSELTTTLSAPPIAEEFTRAKAPLPAIGGVARVYVVPSVAINFELTGMKIPRINDQYEAKYFDLDIHGTVNLTNNVGLEAGWRRMTTYLLIKDNAGDFKFQGMWFGAALRY